jgi:hypothetical protein
MRVEVLHAPFVGIPLAMVRDQHGRHDARTVI